MVRVEEQYHRKVVRGVELWRADGSVGVNPDGGCVSRRLKDGSSSFAMEGLARQGWWQPTVGMGAGRWLAPARFLCTPYKEMVAAQIISQRVGRGKPDPR